MGNHEYAIEDFKQAIEKDPEYPVSHFHMGVSKLKSKDVRSAIVDFNTSLSLYGPTACYDGLGCCYHAKGDFEDAIENFNKAIESKENNVEFLKNRA